MDCKIRLNILLGFGTSCGIYIKKQSPKSQKFPSVPATIDRFFLAYHFKNKNVFINVSMMSFDCVYTYIFPDVSKDDVIEIMSHPTPGRCKMPVKNGKKPSPICKKNNQFRNDQIMHQAHLLMLHLWYNLWLLKWP